MEYCWPGDRKIKADSEYDDCPTASGREALPKAWPSITFLSSDHKKNSKWIDFTEMFNFYLKLVSNTMLNYFISLYLIEYSETYLARIYDDDWIHYILYTKYERTRCLYAGTYFIDFKFKESSRLTKTVIKYLHKINIYHRSQYLSKFYNFLTESMKKKGGKGKGGRTRIHKSIQLHIHINNSHNHNIIVRIMIIKSGLQLRMTATKLFRT